MNIASIRLQNYRSYEDSSFEFSDGVNIVVGPNACGKTNLLDALHYAAVGGPIRALNEAIIRSGQAWARVDCMTSSNEPRVIKLRRADSTIQKEFFINEKPIKRSTRTAMLPVVLFEPSHLYQITTSPDMRRQLIDGILEKIDIDFLSVKNRYLRTLRQRNALLKHGGHDVRQQIFAWDVRLSELGGIYAGKRSNILSKINEQSSQIYRKIAGHEHTVEFNYDSPVQIDAYAQFMHEQLKNGLEIDLRRGFTRYGPHRDDVKIMIDNIDMRSVASRGETRSILLTLKIIEAHLLEAAFNQKPYLLLDDVFGELDGARRKALIDFIGGSQTFITTTDADVIGHEFIQLANIIMIS